MIDFGDAFENLHLKRLKDKVMRYFGSNNEIVDQLKAGFIRKLEKFGQRPVNW